MSDYHTVYRQRGPRETTEWEDSQRALGNLPPLPKEEAPDKWAPGDEPQRGAQRLADMPEQELEALGSSDDELADDAALAELRRRRLAELREAAERARRFGSLVPISAADYIREVTEASDSHRVVLLMAHPGNEVCEALAAALSEVSRRNERTKFVRVVASEAVPGYPRRLCPTLIVYWKGDVVKSVSGLEPFGGTSRLTPENVELVLESCGALDGEEGKGGAEARKERALHAAAEAMASQLALEEQREAEEKAEDAD